MRLKRKKHRHSRRLFLAEGEDLLDAAMSSGARPRQVFMLEGAKASIGLPEVAQDDREIEIFLVSEPVINKLTSLGGNARIAAVFDFVDSDLPQLQPLRDKVFYIYLAGIADPGNIGSLIRSAAALGADGIIMSDDSADPYGPKAVQASMGSIFKIPLHRCSSSCDVLLDWAARLGLAPVATDNRTGASPWDVDLKGNILLMLGAERAGLPAELKQSAALTVMIPQHRGTESLNVAMAGTVLLYEALRQRLTATRHADPF